MKKGIHQRGINRPKKGYFLIVSNRNLEPRIGGTGGAKKPIKSEGRSGPLKYITGDSRSNKIVTKAKAESLSFPIRHESPQTSMVRVGNKRSCVEPEKKTLSHFHVEIYKGRPIDSPISFYHVLLGLFLQFFAYLLMQFSQSHSQYCCLSIFLHLNIFVHFQVEIY